MRAIIPNVTSRKDTGIRKAILYDFRSSREVPAILVGTNLTGTTVDDLVSGLEECSRLRPVPGPYVRMSISFSPGINPTMEEAVSIVRQIANGWGVDLDRRAWTMVMHSGARGGKEKVHIHCTFTRAGWDGSLWIQPFHGYKRLQQIAEAVARRIGLYQQFATEARAPDPELDQACALRRLLGQAVTERLTLTGLARLLNEHGFGLRPNLSSGAHLSGLSFQTQTGKSIKGSALGRSFGLKQLLNQGLRFDPDIDLVLLKAARTQPRKQTAIPTMEQINGTLLPDKQRRDGKAAFVERHSTSSGMVTPLPGCGMDRSEPWSKSEMEPAVLWRGRGLYGHARTHAGGQTALEPSARYQLGPGGRSVREVLQLGDHPGANEGPEIIAGIRTSPSRRISIKKGVPGTPSSDGGGEHGRILVGDLPIVSASGLGSNALRGGLVLRGERNLSDALLSSGVRGIEPDSQQEAAGLPDSRGNLGYQPAVQVVGAGKPQRRRINHGRSDHAGRRAEPRLSLGRSKGGSEPRRHNRGR